MSGARCARAERKDAVMSEKLYTDSDGRECGLAVMCVREPGWAANRIAALSVDVDTQRKAKEAWEALYVERNRLWRDAGDKIDLITGILARNGCDCDCDHSAEEHDDDCERCLACRIAHVLEGE